MYFSFLPVSKARYRRKDQQGSGYSTDNKQRVICGPECYMPYQSLTSKTVRVTQTCYATLTSLYLTPLNAFTPPPFSVYLLQLKTERTPIGIQSGAYTTRRGARFSRSARAFLRDNRQHHSV